MENKAAELKPNHDDFCRAVAGGALYLDAYREHIAGKRKRNPEGKPETQRSNASNFIKRPEIAQRIRELRAELAAEELWTRKQSVGVLTRAIKMAIDDNKPQHMVAAVKELNSMHGFNEPVKVDHTTGGESFNRESVSLVDAAIAKALAEKLIG